MESMESGNTLFSGWEHIVHRTVKWLKQHILTT